MTEKTSTEPHPPRTLAEAHHAADRIRPRQKAPLTAWLVYHQRCAAWYAEVAEIDRGYHHEALYMAEHHRTLATELKARISSQPAASEE